MIARVQVERGAAAWPSKATVRALARRVRRAARRMGLSRAQLDAMQLRIVDDVRMREIKLRSFGVAEATDVLSFPAGEALPGLPLEDEEGASLGEIVLNRDAVARQAGRPGPAGWLDEATSLAIHGVAHLLGHDHDRRDRARRMLACEHRGTRAVGLPLVRPYGGAPRARLVVRGGASGGLERLADEERTEEEPADDRDLGDDVADDDVNVSENDEVEAIDDADDLDDVDDLDDADELDDADDLGDADDLDDADELGHADDLGDADDLDDADELGDADDLDDADDITDADDLDDADDAHDEHADDLEDRDPEAPDDDLDDRDPDEGDDDA